MLSSNGSLLTAIKLKATCTSCGCHVVYILQNCDLKKSCIFFSSLLVLTPKCQDPTLSSASVPPTSEVYTAATSSTDGRKLKL